MLWVEGFQGLGFRVRGLAIEGSGVILWLVQSGPHGFAIVVKELKGSWDLVTGVIIRVTILITTIKVLITLLTKSHDPPRSHLHLHR